MAMLRSKDYGETEARLAADPIVIAMAKGLANVPRSELVHDTSDVTDTDVTPRFEFMQRANAEYRERGGTDGGHIGAVAHALLMVLDAPAATPPKPERDPQAELDSVHRFTQAALAQGKRRVEQAAEEFEETGHSCFSEGHATGFTAAAKLILDFIEGA